MRFEFSTVESIVFGPGALAGVGELARPWGRRALVVAGRDPGRSARLCGLLDCASVACEVVRVESEPTLATVASGLAAARAHRAELIVGIGGGSALDTAKAIAGLMTNPGDLTDYLEIVGRGRPLERPSLPWIAIPTTGGSGAEATRNAVLGVPERGLKVSFRSIHLFARVALVDPELALGLPPAVTAATGMDALTQLIEAYVSRRASPATDVLCAAGLPRAARALPAVKSNPDDLGARSDLALASLWSGQALANAGLGAVHGLAAPIGGRHRSAPHGAVCAALLAPIMGANLAALRKRGAPIAGAERSLRRYGEVAGWLTGRTGATPEDGVAWVRSCATSLGIAPLSTYGIDPGGFPDIVARAQQASSMKSNPIVLNDSELSAALSEAF